MFWAKDEINTLSELLKQGKTLKEIAAVLTTRTERQIYGQMNKFINKTVKSEVPWTEEELKILRIFLEQGMTVTEIQRKMPYRKRGVIYDKIMYDKFNSENSLYRPWTEQDEKILASLTRRGLSHLDIAKLMKRTRQSVSTKCFELNLCQHYNWTNEDDEKLKALIANKTLIDDIAKIMKIKERAIRYRLEKLNLCVRWNQKHKENFELRKICPDKEIAEMIIRRFGAAQIRAKKENLPFNLTREHLLEVFKSQNYLCYYTEAKMKLSGKKEKNTISLDKKIPSLGYIIGNVAFCCNYINIAKSDLTEEQYIDVSKKVFEFSKLKTDKT